MISETAGEEEQERVLRCQHHGEIGLFLGGVVVAFPPSQEQSRAGEGGSRETWETRVSGNATHYRKCR